MEQKYYKALKCFDKAIRMTPGMHLAHYGKGRHYRSKASTAGP